MSVVNDMLKDLHQRRSQQHYIPNIAFVYDDDSEQKNTLLRAILMVLIGLSLSAILVLLTIKIVSESDEYLQNTHTIPSLETHTFEAKALAAHTPDVEIGAQIDELNSNELSALNMAALDESEMPAKAEYQASLGVDFNDIVIEEKALTEKSMAEKSTKKNVINEKPIAKLTGSKDTNTHKTSISPIKQAIPVSKTNVIKDNVTKNKRESLGAPTQVVHSISNDEDFIRSLMLKEPDKVWPYIQKLLPMSDNKVSLIALAAQGEQRSKKHTTALDLYRTLSEIEPNESKWRVGSAISLDALSEHDQALVEYQKSLQMRPLPPPLYSFVRHRIMQLTGSQNER